MSVIEEIRFPSGDTHCAAKHYPGRNGTCVVMAGGLAVTKEPGTDRFAQRFQEAGFGVLAFDYRHLGQSGGQPRQITPVGAQRDDFRAAIERAAELTGTGVSRVAIWGFSSSGGHVFAVAADTPGLGAAIAHSPLADGPAAAPNALRHQTPGASLRFTGRAVLDGLGGRLGREPRLVPLAGQPGIVAALTTPDAQHGARALDPDGRYSDWRQEVSAWSALRIGLTRPGRHAARVQCPLLVIAHDDDQSALPGPAVDAAKRAPRGTVAHLPGGHCDAFMGSFERAVAAHLAFLHRYLAPVLSRAGGSPGTGPR